MKKIFVIMQKAVVNTVGGTITIFVDYCNMLIQHGYDVYGIYSANETNRPDGLNDSIKMINLKNIGDQELSFDNALNSLTEKENPDLFIFFMPNLYAMSKLNKKYDNIPRILMFHGRPDFYFNINKKLTKRLKPHYKNTVAQVLIPSYINLLPDYIKNEKVYYIPNPASIGTKKIDANIEKKKIIFLSRIAPCKGIDFLIKSFKYVVRKHPDWTLDIYGQSQPVQYEKDLEVLIKKLKLEKNVYIKGISSNPLETFLDYDFCVFPSCIEGFPMGLIEAQSTGLPSIGLKGCSGVNELIIDSYNGFLANRNYKDFSNKISTLIKSKDLRIQMSNNAQKEAQKYERVNIYNSWLKLIDNTLNNKFETNITKNVKAKYKLFPISKVIKWDKYDEMMNMPLFKKLILKIFSIKNPNNENRIIVSILGIKLKIKKKNVKNSKNSPF